MQLSPCPTCAPCRQPLPPEALAQFATRVDHQLAQGGGALTAIDARMLLQVFEHYGSAEGLALLKR
jgi:hypothetical protein